MKKREKEGEKFFSINFFTNKEEKGRKEKIPNRLVTK